MNSSVENSTIFCKPNLSYHLQNGLKCLKNVEMVLSVIKVSKRNFGPRFYHTIIPLGLLCSFQLAVTMIKVSAQIPSKANYNYQ